MNTLPPLPQQQQTTTFTDVHIAFGRLVAILLKLRIASIPALICFYAIIGAIAMAFLLVFGGLGAVLSGLNAHHWAKTITKSA